MAAALFERDQLKQAEGQLQATMFAAGTDAAPGENEALSREEFRA
ncbi:MAG TPA: hypothetical protein VLK82_12055 [Candidatus Tectomicrobia bacterium]|nr:hypothetical protein [Candidatus Tectomicrobia bacterium]